MMMEIPAELDVDLRGCEGFYTKTQEGAIAGCVYISPVDNNNCFIVACGFKRKWCTRELVMTVYQRVFKELKCRRVSVIVDASNLPSLKLCFKLGFKTEGLLRGYGTGTGFLLGLLENEFILNRFKG